MNIGGAEAERSTVSFEERNAGFRQIIKRYIEDNRLSGRYLATIGAIRNRKTFRRRLERDELTGGELDALFTSLALDPVKAHAAIVNMRSPERYFDAVSETASMLSTEISRALAEQARACAGDFEPIRQSLCRTIADRAVAQIMAHQARIHEARNAEFIGGY